MFVWEALVTKDLDIVLCVGLLICYTLGTMRVMGGEVTILSAGIQLEVARWRMFSTEVAAFLWSCLR
jgi:hypothetical protein